MQGFYVVLAASLAAFGCNSKKTEAGPAAVPQKAVVTKLGEPAAAAAPTMAATAAMGAQGGATLKGKVKERIDASTYTYLLLDTADGEIWAAVQEAAVPVGAEVEIANPSRMDGFESKTLKRRFDKIVFGYLATNKGAGSPQAQGGMGMAGGGMAGMGMAGHGQDMGNAVDQHAAAAAGPAEAMDVKVPKAEGADARTVAEVWEQKAKLKNAKVTVRGKVVKSNSAMGKTFLHLRDGTGTAADKTNDITVTTEDSAQKGDTVIINGVVHTEVDFGSGYSYPVIIEEAKVKK